MKKLLSLVALVGIMASCNSKKDEKKTDETKTDTATTKVDDTKMDNTGVPTFADAEVQQYVNDYTAFVTGYVDAYKTNNMAKIQELSTKATEWATRSQSVAMKLANNADEAKKFSDYMTKLSQDMSAAMMPK